MIGLACSCFCTGWCKCCGFPEEGVTCPDRFQCQLSTWAAGTLPAAGLLLLFCLLALWRFQGLVDALDGVLGATMEVIPALPPCVWPCISSPTGCFLPSAILRWFGGLLLRHRRSAISSRQILSHLVTAIASERLSCHVLSAILGDWHPKCMVPAVLGFFSGLSLWWVTSNTGRGAQRWLFQPWHGWPWAFQGYTPQRRPRQPQYGWTCTRYRHCWCQWRQGSSSG